MLILPLLSFVLVLFSQAHSAENYEDTKNFMAGLINKVVPHSIQNIFRHKSVSNESAHNNEETVTEIYNKEQEVTEETFDKEHGTLDFFGRDLVREVSKQVNKVGQKIGLTSNSSAGLDSDKGFFSGVVDGFKKKVQAIYPGTKWCGDGDKARTFDDLGRFSDTDRCCREHDLCPNNIDVGDTKYGLKNTGLFTRSHCDCDGNFYQCLKTTNSIISSKIGLTYFSVLGPQCYKEDYAIIGCEKKSSGKCIEYKQDNTTVKFYQWFDSPTW